MDDPLPDVIKGVIKGLREGLPTCKTVVMIETPDGAVYYGGSQDTPLELANMVCSTGWQMASRIAPPKAPTHNSPEALQ